MHLSKTSMTILALVACGLACAHAAGGIKGQRAPEESQQRLGGIKGPRQQQQQQIVQQTQFSAPAPTRIAPAPAKGAGLATPIFSAARVAPPPAPIQQQEQEPETQQQQQQEVEPSPAAQDSAPAVAAPITAAAAAADPAEEANPRPEPYAFNYAFDAGDQSTSGSSQREEQQDANGRVTGFYTLRGEDGRDRRVDYVADANGFRATISTNEMGTAPKDSADVDWQAQSPSDAQLRAADSATQAARQRAALNPQPDASASAPLTKVSSPRQNAAVAASQQRAEVFGAKGPAQQQRVEIAQLQEPFEQIRQTEANTRARKSRHAPFYLYTI